MWHKMWKIIRRIGEKGEEGWERGARLQMLSRVPSARPRRYEDREQGGRWEAEAGAGAEAGARDGRRGTGRGKRDIATNRG